MEFLTGRLQVEVLSGMSRVSVLTVAGFEYADLCRTD